MKDRQAQRGKEQAITPLARRTFALQRKCACGGEAEGECQDCKEQRLQRSRDGSNLTGAVPRTVHNVLRGPGTPLDGAARAVMEPHFGHDFSKVRVHADRAAGESARDVQAAAYTVGPDMVFAPGRYEPATDRGQRLIAHELTHVVQQEQSAPSGSLTIAPSDDQAEREADRAASALGPSRRGTTGVPVSLQRAPNNDWNKVYDRHMSYLGSTYDDYKTGLGELRPTTKGGLTENVGRPIPKSKGFGTPAAPEITLPVLKEIFPLLRSDLDAKAVPEDQIKEYLASLNDAFKMMMIDTVEAQANYLAHAFVESQQFRLMTEIGEKNPATWQKNPKTPDSPAARKYYSDTYKKGGKVNPYGNFEFIGRGPVQVTWRYEYVEAIAMVEKVAADYKAKAAKDPKDLESARFAALAEEAAIEIKKNPEQAANPKYAFLFSAAFIKGKGADVSMVNKDPSQKKWTGEDVVGGGKFEPGSKQDKALVTKATAYHDIYCVLMREAKNAGVKEAEAKYKACQSQPQAKATAKAPGSGY
jgi:hypothetical protein